MSVIGGFLSYGGKSKVGKVTILMDIPRTHDSKFNYSIYDKTVVNR